MELANLDRANSMARDLRILEQDLAAYRETDEIDVYLWHNGCRGHDSYPEHKHSLPATEIRDAVVAATQRGVDAKRAELARLGVTVPGARPPGDPGRP